MGRMYAIVIDGVASPAAAFDAFEIKPNSATAFILHEIVLAQSSDVDSEMLGVAIKRGSGSYTSGSGGTGGIVPSKLNNNEAGSVISAETMNTTQAAPGSGALDTMLADAFNVLTGWHYLPTPECRPVFSNSGACVVAITAPADALTIRGYAIVEETP